MDDIKDVPHIPPLLIKWLREQNPVKTYSPGMASIERVMFDSGRQDIIRDLEELLRQQEEEIEDAPAAAPFSMGTQ